MSTMLEDHNTATKTFQYDAGKAREGLNLLMAHADRLEQVGRNLKAIDKSYYLSEEDRFALFDVKISNRKSFSDTVYDVTIKGRKWEDPNHPFGGYSIERFAKDFAHSCIRRYMEDISGDLMSVGVSAHEIHMEKCHIRNASTLLDLPEILAETQAIMDCISKKYVTEDSKELIVQAQQDANYLSQLQDQLDGLMPHVVEYNKRLAKRQGELTTEQQIEHDKLTRSAQGVNLLTQSEEQADHYNPSYRAYVEKRDKNRRPLPENRPILCWGEVEQDRRKQATQDDSHSLA